jgi:hypothetical protein
MLDDDAADNILVGEVPEDKEGDCEDLGMFILVDKGKDEEGCVNERALLEYLDRNFEVWEEL